MGNSENKKKNKWFTLPPFAKPVDTSVLGAKLAGKHHLEAANETSALNWVLKCCPEQPRSLVQNLFRLRQGGIGIKWSLDELAAACLCFDYSEPPRLLSEQNLSYSILLGSGWMVKSLPPFDLVFFTRVYRLDRDSSGVLVMGRTQTSAAILHSMFCEETIGASKHVVVDDGKSDRITIFDDTKNMSSQSAISEYCVIKTSSHDTTPHADMHIVSL
ncbi:hypothetical protein REPUB_Repub04eG0078600 [Reevesia pubescens]